MSQSVFEVVGGTYAPAPVNFSSYAQASNQTHPQTNQVSPINSQVQSQSHTHPVGAGAGAAVAGFMSPPIITDPFTSFVMILNSNPYIIGILYLFLNLSGRFLTMELTKQQERFLSQPFLRPFILFAVMFVSTRNIAIAFWSTIGILSVIWIFANENHVLCLIPGWREAANSTDTDKSYQDNMKAIQGKEESTTKT